MHCNPCIKCDACMCVAAWPAGSISSKFLQAHLNYLHTGNEGLKGVDGRCLANLTWALAKLDLSSDDSALTTELALTVAPFVIRSLDSSSPQVWHTPSGHIQHAASQHAVGQHAAVLDAQQQSAYRHVGERSVSHMFQH